MALLEWFLDVRLWVRVLVSLIFIGGGLLLTMYITRYAIVFPAVGVALLWVGCSRSDSEKKGYKF